MCSTQVFAHDKTFKWVKQKRFVLWPTLRGEQDTRLVVQLLIITSVKILCCCCAEQSHSNIGLWTIKTLTDWVCPSSLFLSYQQTPIAIAQPVISQTVMMQGMLPLAKRKEPSQCETAECLQLTERPMRWGHARFKFQSYCSELIMNRACSMCWKERKRPSSLWSLPLSHTWSMISNLTARVNQNRLYFFTKRP